jgi:hypothetical protein
VAPFKKGQLVRIRNSKKALIAYHCERRPNYWGVIYIDDKTLNCVHQSLISHYRNSCWNCGTQVDSSKDPTCPVCYWVKCPVCGACRQGGCIRE